MTASIIDAAPLFELSAGVSVNASAERAYSVFSDLPRCGEWSPECQGGTWESGEPGAVGSIFRGENLRPDDVVAWAPLIRGTWHTECRIVVADPGRRFHWMMLSHAGDNQESIWGFDAEPDGDGCRLVHHFRMGTATPGIHKIVADLDEDARARFVKEWGAKLEDDMARTVERLKAIVENS